MLNYIKPLLLSCLLITSISSFSQYYVFGIDVPHGLTGTFKPSFERTFGKHFSVLLNYESGIYSEGTTGNLTSQSAVYQLNGNAFMPSIRYYPFTKKRIAPKGLSLGLYYRVFSFTETYTGEDYDPNRSFQPFNPKPSANIKTKGKATNFGLALAYKFTAGPIIIEPLLGFGSAQGEWDSPNERDRIDPFFKSSFNDFLFSGRAEIKIGFYIPQIKPYLERVTDIPYVKNITLQKSNPTLTDTVNTNEIRLYVYRPKRVSGFAIGYDVTVNDSLSTRMSNGNYHLFILSETSEFKISAKTEEEKTIIANLEAGRTYYLRCTVGAGLFIGRPKFRFVEHSVGKVEFEKLKNN